MLFSISFKISSLIGAIEQNHWAVALNTTGFLVLQSCGYEWVILLTHNKTPNSFNFVITALLASSKYNPANSPDSLFNLPSSRIYGSY